MKAKKKAIKRKNDNKSIDPEIELKNIQSHLTKYKSILGSPGNRELVQFASKEFNTIDLTRIGFDDGSLVTSADGFLGIFDPTKRLRVGFFPAKPGSGTDSDGTFIIQNKEIVCCCNLHWQKTEETYYDHEGANLIINSSDPQGISTSIFRKGKLLCRVFKTHYSHDRGDHIPEYTERVHYFDHHYEKQIEINSEGEVVEKTPAFSEGEGDIDFIHQSKDLFSDQWYTKKGVHSIDRDDYVESVSERIMKVEITGEIGKDPNPISTVWINSYHGNRRKSCKYIHY